MGTKPARSTEMPYTHLHTAQCIIESDMAWHRETASRSREVRGNSFRVEHRGARMHSRERTRSSVVAGCVAMLLGRLGCRKARAHAEQQPCNERALHADKWETGSRHDAVRSVSPRCGDESPPDDGNVLFCLYTSCFVVCISVLFFFLFSSVPVISASVFVLLMFSSANR